jgi:tellurite resistance protein
LSSLQAFFGHSVRLYFAPLTGAVRGIRREYRRLEWAERQRLRRQAEFERRGREAIKRSIAAGNWIPAEEVIEKLRAKVDAARKRRVIGMLRGKLDVPANFDDPLPEEVLQHFEGRLTTDAKLTVTTRAKDDPGFAEALLNEAIVLAANGEPELAKQVLRDLIAGTTR